MNKVFPMILVGDESTILRNKRFAPLSLALGVIGGYLKERNIDSQIYDINEKFARRTYSKEEQESLSNIYDGSRLIRYLQGEDDPDLDYWAQHFLQDLSMEYGFYGVSIGADFSLFQIHQGLLLAKYIQKKTGARVIVGGNNIDYLYIYREFYKELLRAAVENIDYILRGPGEETIEKILLNPSISKEEVKGRLYWKGEIVSNKQAQARITCPDWGELNMSAYAYPLHSRQEENEKLLYSLPSVIAQSIMEHKEEYFRQVPFIPYIFNYNCAYKCAFCTQSAGEREKIVVGQVEKVVDHLAYLSKKYQSPYFYFLNNYFPSSLDYIKDFKEELEKRNLKIYWSDCGRINGMTKEKLELLYECGCRKLIFGFETGDKDMLDYIDKRLDLEELKQVLTWSYEVGIKADIEVIIGLPYERDKEYQNTYNFIAQHKKEVNNFWLNEFFLIPNSLMGTYPERYDIEIKKDLLDYKKLWTYNRQEFLGQKKAEMTSNSRLWGFHEIRGSEQRSFRDIQAHNAKKMKELEKLRNPEFAQLHRFYSMLADIREKRREEKDESHYTCSW